MNNSILINNLKQKKNSSQNNRQIKNNNKLDLSDTTNTKYNPDVEKNYLNIESKRISYDYKYSNHMWKPIIGSIDKKNITTNDLKIDTVKPDYNKIKSNYEIELDERNKERKMAEKSIEEYSKINNLSTINTEKIINSNEINKEDLNNMSNIDNSFTELKRSSKDISSNTNNLNINNIIDSMSKLDILLNSVKNL
jgi:hypothetical protein